MVAGGRGVERLFATSTAHAPDRTRRAALAAARTPRTALLFALAFAALVPLPSLLSAPLPFLPLVKVEDAVTLFAPVVLVALYWLLLRDAGGGQVGPRANLAFLALAAVWIEGHGIHLAANSVGHLLEDAKTTDAYRLTYFYDEELGHYLWHGAAMALAALIVAVEWRGPVAERLAPWWPALAAGVVYGVTFFLIVVEGQTAPLGVPFAALFVVAGLVRGRPRLARSPALAFFATAHLVALLLFAAWGAYWGGLPQFSEKGLL